MNLLKIDILFQSILIIGSIILFNILGDEEAFILFYLVLGGYQLITHYVKWFKGYRSKGRKLYNFCLVVIVTGSIIWLTYYKIFAPMRKGINLPFNYLFTMLAVGLAMALLHFILSTYELKANNKQLST